MPLVAIIAVIVAIAGIVGYLALNKSTGSSDSNLTSMLTDDESQEHGGRQSLLGILGLGANMECTFADNEGNDGTVYIASSDNVRGDFRTTSDSEVLNSHMIIKGDDMYIWMDGAEDGFKASISASQDAAESIMSATGNSDTVDINEEVDYECHGWAVDNSKFNLPADVEFQDFSAMMEGFGEMMMEENGSGDLSAPNCSVCDTLPADAQAQCLQALGC